MKKSELRQLIREEISKVSPTNEISWNLLGRSGKNPEAALDRIFYKFAEPSYKAFLAFVQELKRFKNSEMATSGGVNVDELINTRMREFLEDTYDIEGLDSYDFVNTQQIK